MSWDKKDEDLKCSTCGSKVFYISKEIKIDERLIRLGVSKGSIVNKFTCISCGKLYSFVEVLNNGE